jgi:4'-phosphopantetheinyl transferase
MSIQTQSEHEPVSAPERIRWAAGPLRVEVRSDALHLWRIRTDERGVDLADALDLLGERQRARAEGMRHRPYRDRYIRAHAGLREILSRYLDEPPRSIRFVYGPAGKPALSDESVALSFNLTTTGDLALVAVCAGIGPSAEVGVDCEWVRPRHDILAVAQRMLEPDVAQAIAAAPEQDRLKLFYRAWTALEADAKADGRGLFRPRPPDAHRPSVLNWIPETGYIGAVARRTLPCVAEWSAYDLRPTAERPTGSPDGRRV